VHKAALTPVTLWTDDSWRRDALAWTRQELQRMGRDVVGEPDQFHVRPWSTIFRVPTIVGNVYLKAVPRRLAHEVRLTRWLARHFPDRVLPVLAADDGRGFMLLPEGGVRLRDLHTTDLRVWCQLAATYAELQVRVEPHVSELLALGVPDRRLVHLPNAIAAVLPARDRDLVRRYAALCDELAAQGVPETIQMDDLHDENVFTDGDRLRVFDWGDASLAHPFFSLPMLLETAMERLGLAPDALERRRVRDAYLEPFTRFAAVGALRAAAKLAPRVVPTVRILAWQLAYEHTPSDQHTGQWGETLDELIQQQRAALA
jgi:hypothetical protein